MALAFGNRTGKAVWTAFAYHDLCGGAGAENFRAIGWWEIPTGQTLTAWDVDLRRVNRYAYFYAESADGASWTGPGASLNVCPHAFNQMAFDEPDDGERVGFVELDFAGNYGLDVILGPRDGQYSFSSKPFPTATMPGTGADGDGTGG